MNFSQSSERTSAEKKKYPSNLHSLSTGYSNVRPSLFYCHILALSLQIFFVTNPEFGQAITNFWGTSNLSTQNIMTFYNNII